MSISGPGGLPSSPSLIPAARTARPRAQSASAVDGAPSDASAAAATAAISQQIANAQRESDQLRLQSEEQLNQLSSDYDAQIATESSRSETAIENQKTRGYESVRELKRTQDQDIARTRREGEQQLQDVGNFYRDAIYSNSTRGEKELYDDRRKHEQMASAVKRDQDGETELLKTDHRLAIQALHDTTGEQLQGYQKQTSGEIERARANSEATIEKAKTMYDQRFSNTITQRTGEIMDLETDASRQLKQVRQDTAQKISAYSSRQNDPFYKMIEYDAQLDDKGDHYQLRVKLPQHEQGNVAVTVRGNQLVLSGHRRNEEKLDLGPGMTKSTGTYQSFNQTFPLAWPVDAHRLDRSSSSDTLTITVPKTGGIPAPERHPAAESTPRARLERPRYPENLPLSHTEDPNTTPDGDPSGTGRTSRREDHKPLL